MISESSRPPKAVTRADVARYAGVSTAVVSYVMNGGPKPVAAATAARVREAIEVLRYRPNVNAQALRRGSTQMLGLILSDITNPFFGEFARAIEAAAFPSGHALMSGNSHGDPSTERRLVEDFARRQVDGLLVGSVWDRPDLADALTPGGPSVVWVDAWHAVPGYSSVGSDGRAGMSEAVRHLIEVHGHTSIGLVAGERAGGASDPRELGWSDALRAAGLPEGPIGRGAWGREGGYAAASELLDRPDRPTALAASSDLQAIGVLRAARVRGLALPGDLAVVSFDGTAESEFSWPPLTVARQPVPEMAAAAVGLVLEPEPVPRHHTFMPVFTPRTSCGCQADGPPT